MLDRARERVGRTTTGSIEALQGDIREVELPDQDFDIYVSFEGVDGTFGPGQIVTPLNAVPQPGDPPHTWSRDTRTAIRRGGQIFLARGRFRGIVREDGRPGPLPGARSLGERTARPVPTSKPLKKLAFTSVFVMRRSSGRMVRP